MTILTALLLCLQDPNQMDPGELEKAVDKAITNGVEWLKKQQKADGSFGDSSGPTYGPGQAYHNRPGIAALSLLALLKSDVEPTDPVIQKGFKFIYEYLGNSGNLISNYDMGVILMAIESLYEGMVKALMKKQGKKTNERAGDFKEPKYSLSGGDVKVCSTLLKKLYENQTKEGGWRYGQGFGVVGSEDDISATQIVMLGFKSASRMKLAVDAGSVKRAMDFVLRSQDKGDGKKIARENGTNPGDRGTYASMGEDVARGWAYEKKSENKEETTVSGSMTTAGITVLLTAKSMIGKALGKKENEKIEQCIYDGFAWLLTKWTMDANPDSQRSHYYFLYGIERVATLGCFEKIGKHYWYREGAEVLVKAQQGDGHWDTGREVAPSNINDTCFALLFLRRGTVPIGDVMTGGRGGGK